MANSDELESEEMNFKFFWIKRTVNIFPVLKKKLIIYLFYSNICEKQNIVFPTETMFLYLWL